MALVDNLTKQQKRNLGLVVGLLTLGAIGGLIYWSGRPWTCAQAKGILTKTRQQAFAEDFDGGVVERNRMVEAAFEKEAELCGGL
jgi:hypothetical protein